jgi:flagellar hook-length control protein FliK
VCSSDLTLPRLGHVQARLGLSGNQISLGLTADDIPTREAMQTALPDLVAALQAAGLEPVRISITGGEEPSNG